MSYAPGDVCFGSGCSGFPNCRLPIVPAQPTIEILPEAGGTFTARLTFEVTAPWNKDSTDQTSPNFHSNSQLDMIWFDTPAVCGGGAHVADCQYLSSDTTRCYLEKTGLSCAGAPYDFGTYAFRAQVCQGPGPCGFPFPPPCGKWVDRPNLAFKVSKAMLHCPEPPKQKCNTDPSASCPSCTVRGVGPGQGGPGINGAGGGGSGPGIDGSGGSGPRLGPGAHLRYAAGGAGGTGFPGTASWRVTLGRYWSHDYAERIVVDPDPGHVWLITRWATFREFNDADGDGLYEHSGVSPSDEYRQLSHTAAGWELRDLDGTVDRFDTAGLWTRRTDRNGNAKVATYGAGGLSRVDFPDGRHEDFSYAASGKLASITEVGVDGTSSHLWTYTWAGDDLVRVDRPDGTAVAFSYEDPRHPGYVTRLELVGTDASHRLDSAWQYDDVGNVVATWAGDATAGVNGPEPGPAAVDLYTFSFDNPIQPTEATVVDPLGQPAVYQLGRDPRSPNIKVLAMSGSCPSCGTGPSAVFDFADVLNPMRPTGIVDGKGHRTELTYDAFGQVTRRLEAVDDPALTRETDWVYGLAGFPAFPTEIRRDAPAAPGGRVETLTYDPTTGDLLERTLSGAEATQPGGAFSLTTSFAYNAAGRVTATNPPGYTTDDQTTFTYDPARGDLLPLSRTDPLVGTTTFGLDAFNRRVTSADPNGLVTETTFDALDRVTRVVRRDPVTGTELVTENLYDVFGDLAQTTLPAGNVLAYTHDATGRLVGVARQSDATTPGERTLFTLDAAGDRVREDLERWDAGTAAWVTDRSTVYERSTRCHVDRVIEAPGTPEESVTELGYDCNGNLESTWDADHPSTASPPTQTVVYDALDRQISITQPWGGAGGGSAVTTYGYDVEDHLTRVTDAEGNTTTYTYSDRDLLTAEVSPVSGTTTSAYNEHGELVSRVDARGVETTRTVDPLDRVTAVDVLTGGVADPALHTAYTYDDAAVPFSKGRLTRMERPAAAIDYRYDRFGRVLQDGALGFAYDANGNRTEVTYPGGVSALYGYDFADRPTSLDLVVGAAAPRPVVTSVSYLAGGPLTHADLGNGLAEARTYDGRYAPAAIAVPGLLDWTYATDPVGNILSITGSSGGVTLAAQLAYQDVQYFLTSASGPWGSRGWTYDRIGNRTSEATDVTATYGYGVSAGGGHTPRLETLTVTAGPADAPSLAFSYDAAGDETAILQTRADADASTALTSLLAYNGEGRLSRLSTDRGVATTDLLYDGRGFLAQSLRTLAGSTDFQRARPTYGSEGLLYSVQRDERTTTGATGSDDLGTTTPGTTSTTSETTHLLYFAGRPVAQLELPAGGTAQLLWLTTDHLGSPILATDEAGSLVWAGLIAPFGDRVDLAPGAPTGGDTDANAPPPPPPDGGGTPPPPVDDGRQGSPAPPAPAPPGPLDDGRGSTVFSLGGRSITGSPGDRIFLRYPGQWVDGSFGAGAVPGGVVYNVHRWLEPQTGRYTRPDPLGLREGESLYPYAEGDPLRFSDPFGLKPCSCNDRCPGGEWASLAGGGSYAGIYGRAVSAGLVWCKSRPSVHLWYRSECLILGLIGGIGAGVEVNQSYAPTFCGCNFNDVLGVSNQLLVSVGPFSGAIGKCEQSSAGRRFTFALSLAKSIGGGAAWLRCRVKRIFAP